MASPGESFEANFLERAFLLAEEGRGTTAPNPMVGAVVVSHGVIVGEGRHLRAGGAHAEIEALTAAGERARGADMYVSLEPCCHHGRTPPCTDAIIKAGATRVIVGAPDPNPIVAGGGVLRLKEAGLEVIEAGAPAQFSRQNEMFVKYITRNEAFLVLKVAASLDGMISKGPGERTLLSGDEANRYVHTLRRNIQAVAVGAGTAVIDDPLLTCRLDDGAGERQPLRIVIDSTGRTPLTGRLAKSTDQGPVALATTERLLEARRREYEATGIEVMVCAANSDEQVDLHDLLKQLAKREIIGVMIEGGSTLNESLVSEGVIDKLVMILAPRVLGGPKPVPMLAGAVMNAGFDVTETRILGEDVLLEAYPRRD